MASYGRTVRYLESDLVPPVSRIGLGTWQFGSREWGYGARYARGEAARIVDRALELGVTLFDTAEIYALGRSERILGRALASRREQAFIATKLFPLLPIAAVVERRGRASARRLGVERLDLYQVHWPSPVVADAATMRGMRALQAQGLVGEVGVSNYSLSRWQSAEAALGSRVLSNQVRYSLVERSAELELIPYARAKGRLVIAYSPLAQGFLSGQYDTDRLPRLDDPRPMPARDPGRLDGRPARSERGRRRTRARAGRNRNARRGSSRILRTRVRRTSARLPAPASGRARSRPRGAAGA